MVVITKKIYNLFLIAHNDSIIASFKLQVGREDTDKRLKLLQKLQTMKGEEEKLTLEIQKYRDSDPEALEKMKKEITVSAAVKLVHSLPPLKLINFFFNYR